MLLHPRLAFERGADNARGIMVAIAAQIGNLHICIGQGGAYHMFQFTGTHWHGLTPILQLSLHEGGEPALVQVMQLLD